MTSPQPPPLDPVTADLLAAERAAPSPDDAMKQAIRAQLTASIAAGVTPESRGLETPRRWPRVLVASGVGALLLGITVTRVLNAPDPAPAAVSQPAPVSARAEPAPPVNPEPVAVVTVPVPEVKPRPTPVRKRPPVTTAVLPEEAPPVEEPAPPEEKPAAPVEDPLAGERRILDQARAALRKSLPADAMDALLQHQEHFPAGQLTEERKALRVVALARSGHVEQAEQEARAFVATWPASMFIPALKGAVPQAFSPAGR